MPLIILAVIDPMSQLIEKIKAEQLKFVLETQSLSSHQAFRKLEFFLNAIEESWRDLKVSSLPGQHPLETVTLTEELANLALDYIENEDRNSIVQRGEMLGRIASKVDGINVSEQLKNRIQDLNRSINWY